MMEQLAFNVPINPVSFGQVSINLLREARKRDMLPAIFPIAGGIDLSSEEDSDFNEWIQSTAMGSTVTHQRSNPCVKLWHLNGGLESFSNNNLLISFYELDLPTSSEKNIVNNVKTVFTSTYTKDIFAESGCECHFIPLAFDSHNFKQTGKEYHTDERIVFNLCGKFEKRKHHAKILNAWAKEFGGNTKYHLQCALYNKFLKPEQNNSLIGQALEGKRYPNIQFLNHMPKNTLYNDYLNSGNIVIGMSGGEGWGLPEFQSLCLGKHGVILNAHAYKDWANEENSVLVEPSNKIPALDNIFFNQGSPFNQGSIFDWEDKDFIEGCHKAIKRVEESRLNKKGVEVGEKLTYSKMLDNVLELL